MSNFGVAFFIVLGVNLSSVIHPKSLDFYSIKEA